METFRFNPASSHFDQHYQCITIIKSADSNQNLFISINTCISEVVSPYCIGWKFKLKIRSRYSIWSCCLIGIKINPTMWHAETNNALKFQVLRSSETNATEIWQRNRLTRVQQYTPLVSDRGHKKWTDFTTIYMVIITPCNFSPFYTCSFSSSWIR